MHYKRPVQLENSIKVTGYNRPIKVAFIIKTRESEENHKILDAIFEFSYTCWSGAKFLIIPARGGEIKDPRFVDWLDEYDADIVYSFVPLNDELIKKIEKINSPAFLIEHEFGKERKYLAVKMEHYCQPVCSISTIHSPLAFPQFRFTNATVGINVISQNAPLYGDRFITDNFGNQFSSNVVLHEIRDLFGTICLTPQDTPDHFNVGTYKVHSPAEVIDKLANREATSVSRLASIHSESITPINANAYSDHFTIFVGTSVQDRFCFWNSRKFYPERHESACSLILSPDQFSDDRFVEALGGYLNNLNFIGDNGNEVALRSRTVSIDDLNEIRDKIQKKTHNRVSVASLCYETVVPTKQELEHSLGFFVDKFNFSVLEDISNTRITSPEHFEYINPKYTTHYAGEFLIECRIDRHNNLSTSSNIVDTWLLPRRAYTSRVFGASCLRISKNNLPTFVAGKKRLGFGRNHGNTDLSLEITLPSDIEVINYLLVGKKHYSMDDKRHGVLKTNIEYITHSPMGKNLMGVISMFDSLNEAAALLTNRLWRDVYEHVSQQDSDNYIFEYGKIFSFRPQDGAIKKHLMEQLLLNSPKKASQFITACFKDVVAY
ncbi:MAG: hypothetical protein OFPII_05140 [Osedax symbiont Rs1]|nr:MAG: hypothetical protein OFPII_05140 [Osedax symbiont Rs1]